MAKKKLFSVISILFLITGCGPEVRSQQELRQEFEPLLDWVSVKQELVGGDDQTSYRGFTWAGCDWSSEGLELTSEEQGFCLGQQNAISRVEYDSLGWDGLSSQYYLKLKNLNMTSESKIQQYCQVIFGSNENPYSLAQSAPEKEIINWIKGCVRGIKTTYPYELAWAAHEREETQKSLQPVDFKISLKYPKIVILNNLYEAVVTSNPKVTGNCEYFVFYKQRISVGESKLIKGQSVLEFPAIWYSDPGNENAWKSLTASCTAEGVVSEVATAFIGKED